MKISEMNNEQAAEALIRLSAPLGNICDDEEMVALIDEYGESNKLPFIQTVGRLLPKAVTYALKSHKDDLYEIVGALTFKTREQVAEMNFFETIKAVRDSYDEVFAGFFISSGKPENKTGGGSSQA